MEKTAFPEAAGGRGSIFKFDPEQILLIQDPEHPLFDPRALLPPDDAMVASIVDGGVDTPISVIRGDDGQPIVVAGRRRTIAAREANKILKRKGLPIKFISAVYRDETETEAIGAMIRENALREDEGLTAKAEKARKACLKGYTPAQVAPWYGVTTATIENWLDVARLHPKAKKALDEGGVRLIDAVRSLAKLPEKDQPAALAKLQAEKPTKAVRKAEAEKTGNKAKRQISPAARLKRLTAFIEEESAEPIVGSIRGMAAWLNGQVTDDDLLEAFPRLAGMFEKRGKRTDKAA